MTLSVHFELTKHLKDLEVFGASEQSATSLLSWLALFLSPLTPKLKPEVKHKKAKKIYGEVPLKKRRLCPKKHLAVSP